MFYTPPCTVSSSQVDSFKMYLFIIMLEILVLNLFDIIKC